MQNKPTILIIFGISGDLAKRYLIPAIENIKKAKMLPDKFKVVGITRQKSLDYFQMNLDDIKDCERLNEYLKKIEESFGMPTQRLFYLSVPPEASHYIIELLSKSELSKVGETKILLEKPFGINLENATDLVTYIDQYFLPTQVYRVDHYMAKELAQNIIVFRAGNSLFKKTWNKDFIESIEIIVSEKIDIEGRANFYEQTGALRDVVQSHLLQLAAFVLMELPNNQEEVSLLREKAFKNLNIVCDIEKSKCVKRAQYEGYRDEVKNKNSMSVTETFVSINLKSNDPVWLGVPITLTTGKALNERYTVIKVCYKKDNKDYENQSNELLIRIQPDPGIEFSIWTKVPGYEHKVSQQSMHFFSNEYYKELPDAYEQVLFNAINSDHSLFTSSGEVLETWRILDMIQKTWKKSTKDLITYPKGSTIEEITKKFNDLDV